MATLKSRLEQWKWLVLEGKMTQGVYNELKAFANGTPDGTIVAFTGVMAGLTYGDIDINTGSAELATGGTVKKSNDAGWRRILNEDGFPGTTGSIVQPPTQLQT